MEPHRSRAGAQLRSHPQRTHSQTHSHDRTHSVLLSSACLLQPTPRCADHATVLTITPASVHSLHRSSRRHRRPYAEETKDAASRQACLGGDVGTACSMQEGSPISSMRPRVSTGPRHRSVLSDPIPLAPHNYMHMRTCASCARTPPLTQPRPGSVPTPPPRRSLHRPQPPPHI